MNNPMRDTWPVPESVIMQAEKLRHDGNDYYRRNFIGAAIDAYTEVAKPALLHSFVLFFVIFGSEGESIEFLRYFLVSESDVFED